MGYMINNLRLFRNRKDRTIGNHPQDGARSHLSEPKFAPFGTRKAFKAKHSMILRNP